MKTKEVIKISELAKRVLINAYLISKEVEIGGFLVGLKKKRSFLVTHCLVDYNPTAANRYGVVISTKNLYKKLQFLVNTYTNIDYIGEWHTHPKGCCNLSKIDYKTMLSMLNKPVYGNFSELIHIICSETSEKRICLNGYIFRDNSCIRADIKEISISKVISILIDNLKF